MPPAGFASIEEGPQPRHYRLFAVMADAHLKSRVAALLLNRLIKDLADLAATKLWTREDGKQQAIYHFFAALDLEETRRFTAENGTEIVVMERDLTTPLRVPPLLPAEMVARLVGADKPQNVAWVRRLSTRLATGMS